MEGLKKAFAKTKAEGRAALVGYFTSGYPTADQTADVMLGLQAGGVGMVPSYTLDHTEANDLVQT